MFTAWVCDSAGDVKKRFDDCMAVSVLTEEQMQEKFPEIIDAIGFTSDYICLTDSQGRHFYPLYIYSVNIGQGVRHGLTYIIENVSFPWMCLLRFYNLIFHQAALTTDYLEERCEEKGEKRGWAKHR